MKIKKKRAVMSGKKTINTVKKKKKSVLKIGKVSVKKTVKPKTKNNPVLCFRRSTDFYIGNKDAQAVEQVKGKELKLRRISDIAQCEFLNDSDLVKVVHHQNPQAYKVLCRRYEKGLFVYMFHMVGNKEEVEDLLQNVFSKTYKNLHRFDTARKFSSWIYRIAHNEAVNFIKRRSKRRTISWEDVSSSKDKLQTSFDGKDGAEIFMQKEISQEVDEAMDRLSEKYKKILLLRYFNEYSYQKIGKIINKPVNTVGTLINRAKKKLFEVIEEKKH